MTSRGLTPVVGVVVLVVITMVLTGLIAGIVAGDWRDGSTSTVALSLTVTTDGNGVLELRHEGGETIDLEAVSMQVSIDDEPLKYQPEVPSFNPAGFHSPGGAFHWWSGSLWRPGEQGTLTLAGSNDPSIESGSTVTVVVIEDGHPIAQVTTTASP